MMVHVLFRPVHVVDGNDIIFYFQRVIYNILPHEFFTFSHSYKENKVVWNISPVFIPIPSIRSTILLTYHLFI